MTTTIKDLIIDYKEGMEITEPCIVRGMPDTVYHATSALSNSGLKELLDCPAKYYYKYLSGEYVEKEKANLKIGKACHCYILEGKEAFEKKYWHNPYSELKKEEIVDLLVEKFGYSKTISSEKLTALHELLIDSAGIEVKEIHLSASELNIVVGTAKAIKSNELANNSFSQEGESELSIFWQDEETGIWKKCRPDFLPYNCKNVPDYKTSDTVDPEIFYRKFISYGYHIQAAMYREGIYQVTKYLLPEPIEVENFYFLAQEKTPPFITQPYIPNMNMVNYGDKAIRNGVMLYLECMETGIWRGYSDKVIEMTLETKPDELAGNFDAESGFCYAPKYIDTILQKYEVM